MEDTIVDQVHEVLQPGEVDRALAELPIREGQRDDADAGHDQKDKKSDQKGGNEQPRNVRLASGLACGPRLRARWRHQHWRDGGHWAASTIIRPRVAAKVSCRPVVRRFPSASKIWTLSGMTVTPMRDPIS